MFLLPPLDYNEVVKKINIEEQVNVIKIISYSHIITFLDGGFSKICIHISIIFSKYLKIIIRNYLKVDVVIEETTEDVIYTEYNYLYILEFLFRLDFILFKKENHPYYFFYKIPLIINSFQINHYMKDVAKLKVNGRILFLVSEDLLGLGYDALYNIQSRDIQVLELSKAFQLRKEYFYCFKHFVLLNVGNEKEYYYFVRKKESKVFYNKSMFHQDLLEILLIYYYYLIIKKIIEFLK